MRILIVDDEALARERLRRLLVRLKPEAELREAASGREALELMEQWPPEVLLLDIRMPEMDGVAVARKLLALHEPPALIFCTAYDEYALDALRHQAVAYLLKPVRERELDDALRAAVRINRAQLDALGVAGGGREEIVSAGHRGVETLDVAEVRCFLAEDKYVRVCAPGAELLLSETLKELEQEYPARFLRVHRNALVAAAHVLRLTRQDNAWVVELAGVDERPQVSRRHLAALKEALTGRPGGDG